MSDSELTSLTWLSSIDTGGVSDSDQKESNNNAGVIIVGEYHGGTNRPVSYSLAAARSRGTANYRSPGGHLRPPCSYSCLIAMALTASPTGCLPVNEIYHFIEYVLWSKFKIILISTILGRNTPFSKQHLMDGRYVNTLKIC